MIDTPGACLFFSRTVRTHCCGMALSVRLSFQGGVRFRRGQGRRKISDCARGHTEQKEEKSDLHSFPRSKMRNKPDGSRFLNQDKKNRLFSRIMLYLVLVYPPCLAALKQISGASFVFLIIKNPSVARIQKQCFELVFLGETLRRASQVEDVINVVCAPAVNTPLYFGSSACVKFFASVLVRPRDAGAWPPCFQLRPYPFTAIYIVCTKLTQRQQNC